MRALRPNIARVIWFFAGISWVPVVARDGFAQRLGVSTAIGTPASTAVQPLVINRGMRDLGMRGQDVTASCERSRIATVAQAAAGMFGAWIGGLGAYTAVNEWDPSPQVSNGDDPYKPNANTAYAIGSWVGSTTLTFLAGSPRCGSLGRTALGAGIPSALLLFGRHEPYLPIVGFILAPVQAAVGTAMFPKR